MLDLTEIKKLSDVEKWKIIEEIEGSMVADSETTDTNYERNLNQLLEERLAAYHQGETNSYTWEEVQNRLKTVREKINTPQNA